MMLERVLEPEVMDTWEDAVEYDAMDFTEVNTAFAERALELGPPSGNVLDLGTGTARIPILIAQRNTALRIVAVDYSKNMLKVGSRNVNAAQLDHRIVLEFVDAKNLLYRDESFDLVISNSLVHHLPDPLPFLKELKRVAKSNAGILIRDLIRPVTTQKLEGLVSRYAAECNDHQRKLFRDSLLASFTIDEINEMVQTAGLGNMSISQSSDRHWSAERRWRRISSGKESSHEQTLWQKGSDSGGRAV